MDVKTFGEWLRVERGVRGLSQAAVERKAGISHSHFSKIERKQIPHPTEETREKIHRVFGTSDDDLVRAGILRPRELRSMASDRAITIYEYVTDNPPPVEPVEVPASLATLLRDIEWTPENVEAITPFLKRIARADAQEPTPSPGTPARTPQAAREPDRAKREP